MHRWYRFQSRQRRRRQPTGTSSDIESGGSFQFQYQNGLQTSNSNEASTIEPNRVIETPDRPAKRPSPQQHSPPQLVSQAEAGDAADTGPVSISEYQAMQAQVQNMILMQQQYYDQIMRMSSQANSVATTSDSNSDVYDSQLPAAYSSAQPYVSIQPYTASVPQHAPYQHTGAVTVDVESDGQSAYKLTAITSSDEESATNAQTAHKNGGTRQAQ